MAKETMTAKERVLAAINLEKPDRVPVAPQVTAHTSPGLTGRTQAEVAQNVDVALDTMLQVFDHYGGWDMVHMPTPSTYFIFNFVAGIRVKVPGRELPEDVPFQIWEEENVKREEYDIIADIGWTKFVTEQLIPRINDDPADFGRQIENFFGPFMGKAFEEWGKRNTYPVCWALDFHPFFKLSLSRSMLKYTEDLYRHPELVEKALDKMVPETIEGLKNGAKLTQCNIVQIIEERAGGYFYPTPVFERFWWKYTREIVDALWSEGIVTLFHLDTNWDKNIHYFKEIPKGSAIIMLDGTTDIFAAKEALRGHLCLMGDVHPSLSALGSKEEVEAYVKKLIDEVGGDGGFILGTGCDVPAAVKPENLRAIIDTGKSYELNS